MPSGSGRDGADSGIGPPTAGRAPATCASTETTTRDHRDLDQGLDRLPGRRGPNIRLRPCLGLEPVELGLHASSSTGARPAPRWPSERAGHRRQAHRRRRREHALRHGARTSSARARGRVGGDVGQRGSTSRKPSATSRALSGSSAAPAGDPQPGRGVRGARELALLAGVAQLLGCRLLGLAVLVRHRGSPPAAGAGQLEVGDRGLGRRGRHDAAGSRATIRPASSRVNRIFSGNPSEKAFSAGAARVSRPSATSATSIAAIIGAAIWTAPEQLRRRRLVTARATWSQVSAASASSARCGPAVQHHQVAAGGEQQGHRRDLVQPAHHRGLHEHAAGPGPSPSGTRRRCRSCRRPPGSSPGRRARRSRAAAHDDLQRPSASTSGAESSRGATGASRSVSGRASAMANPARAWPGTARVLNGGATSTNPAVRASAEQEAGEGRLAEASSSPVTG